MKAILIDSKNREVKVVQVDESDVLKSIKEHLKCDYITTAPMNNPKFGISKGQNVMFCDDEGLINGTKTGFSIDGMYESGIAGNGLILGNDGAGGEADVTLHPEMIEASWGVVRGA